MLIPSEHHQANLQHSKQYPMERFREISGHLTIVGLSPMNDNHVFDEVAANDGVDAIDFHFYAEDEAAEVAKRLEGKDVTFLNVRDLWTELEAR